MPHATRAGATGTMAITDDMRRCLELCQECARICWETISYCADKAGEHVSQAHLAALIDCAQLCDSSAQLLARGSELHPALCGICADACQSCGESCEQFGDDEQMMRCADVCRRCASSCREMASAA